MGCIMGDRTLLKRVSYMTGIENQMEINADRETIEDWIENRYERPLIQKAFPNLTKEEREFILTGITPEEWASIEEEEDET
jgi:hypothetical protein